MRGEGRECNSSYKESRCSYTGKLKPFAIWPVSVLILVESCLVILTHALSNEGRSLTWDFKKSRFDRYLTAESIHIDQQSTKIQRNNHRHPKSISGKAVYAYRRETWFWIGYVSVWSLAWSSTTLNQSSTLISTISARVHFCSAAYSSRRWINSSDIFTSSRRNPFFLSRSRWVRLFTRICTSLGYGLDLGRPRCRSANISMVVRSSNWTLIYHPTLLYMT